MTKENITYANIIPLIGGMAFGAQKILNKKPEFILSYAPFLANDSLLTNYWNDVPYHVINEDNTQEKHLNSSELPDVDIFLALCPCAGLSQLNCSKTRGSEAPQNDWLYKSTEYVLGTSKPKVLFGENAPALYDGKHGVIVLERLKEIGIKYGYSLSCIKTNSYLHGVPQNRKRSFYMFWKDSKCPILEFTKEEAIKSLDNYLDLEVNIEDIVNATNALSSSHEYQFITCMFGDTWRSKVKEGGYSLLEYIIHNLSLDLYLKYLNANNCEEKYIKKIEYIKNKLDIGLNFRDWSYHISNKYTNSLTGARMDVIHPTAPRLLTTRELMYLMGLPSDMEIPKTKDLPKLFQNVPSTTASYWFNEICEALLGNRKYNESTFLKQNNIKKITEAYN